MMLGITIVLLQARPFMSHTRPWRAVTDSERPADLQIAFRQTEYFLPSHVACELLTQVQPPHHLPLPSVPPTPQVSNWRQWFVLLGRVAPSDQDMSDLLRCAWRHGAAQGYHRSDMDFSRVQRSGVSKILLKGQSYGMPPATKSGE